MKKEKKFPVKDQAKTDNIKHPFADHYQTSMTPEFPQPGIMPSPTSDVQP